MADKTYDILIEIRSQVESITKMTNELGNARKEAEGFNNAFKIGGAVEITHQLTEAAREVPRVLADWLKQGVEFNAEIQKTQTALAGLFRQEAPGQFQTFDRAREAAGQTVELLKAKANELGVAYTDMFDSFEHAQAQMATGGITNIREEINLISVLNRAMQSLGVSSQQASRDIGDILQGQASRTLGGGRLGAAMGMSKEELDQNIQSWKQAGTLYQELTTRLAGFQEAGRAASQNFNSDVTRMQNAILDLKAAAAGPIMEPLTDSIEKLAKIMQSADAKILATDLGKFIKEFAVDTTIAFLGWQAIGGFVLQVDQNLLHLLPGAKLFASLIGATPPKPSDDHFDIREFLESGLNKQREKANGLLDLQIQKQGLSKNTLEEIKKIEDDIALKKATASGDTEAIAQERAKTAYEETLKVAREKNVPQAEAVRLAEAERDATLALWRGREAHKTTLQDIVALERQEADLMRDIKQRQQPVDENPFLSAQDKQERTHQLLIEEQQAVDALVVKYKAYIEAHNQSTDPAEQEKLAQLASKLRDLGVEYELLGFKIKTTTASGEFQKDLNQWVNSFGTASHQIAQTIEGTINAALQGTNNLLLDSIFSTGDWRQALVGVERQVLNLFMTMIEQMVLQHVLGETQKATSTATSISQAGAQLAAQAPLAAATSISSYGSAAVVGEIAAVAAIIAIIAALSGAFKEGGLTGSGPSLAVVGEEGPEFVFTHKATKNIGAANLYAMMHAAENAPHFGTGGRPDDIEPGWLAGADLPNDFFGGGSNATGPMVDLGFGERPIFRWPYGGPSQGGYMVESGINIYPGEDDAIPDAPPLTVGDAGLFGAGATLPVGPGIDPNEPSVFPGGQPGGPTVQLFQGAPGDRGAPYWNVPGTGGYAPPGHDIAGFGGALGFGPFSPWSDLGYGTRPGMVTVGNGPGYQSGVVETNPNISDQQLIDQQRAALGLPPDPRSGGSSSSPVSGIPSPVSPGMRWDFTQGRYVASNNATGAQFNSQAANALMMWYQSMGGNPNNPPVGDAGRDLFRSGSGRIDPDTGAIVPVTLTNAGSRDSRWVFPSQSESAALGLSFSGQKFNDWLIAHNPWFYTAPHGADGMRLPGAPSHTDTMLAWLASGEQVSSATDTLFIDRILGGHDWAERLANLQIPVAGPHFAAGGRLGGGAQDSIGAAINSGQGGINIKVIPVTDWRAALKEREKDPDHRTFIVDTVNTYHHRLGNSPSAS
jgi:hypothetical protein